MFKRIENAEEYKRFLNKVEFKTFFHNTTWENFLEKEFSWLRFEHYIWRDEALLSIARCKLFGKEKLVSHPFCEYGGPLSLKGEIDLESFQKDFLKEFGEKARIKFHPYFRRAGDCSLAHSRPPAAASEVRPGQSMLRQASNPPGNNPQPSLATFWIKNFSRKTKEDLWRGFRKTLRQEIKKSGQCKMEIKECESEDELKQFYNLYTQTTKRHKNIPLPFSVFRFFFNHPDAKIFLAKLKGKIIGGSIFLFYKPFIHYFISALDFQFRKYKVGHKILWHVMQKYVGHRKSHIGYDYFDLGGTRKDSALEIFKRGWGAEEHPIYELGLLAGGGGNSPFRNLLGIIPTSVAQYINRYALWMKI